MRLVIILFSIFIASISFSQAQTPLGPPPPLPTPQATPTEETPEDVVRVTTSLVTVPVVVKDKNGNDVTDLKREDFRLYEDGVEQQIAFFGSVEQPFTVVLLIDTSTSTRAYLADIKEAAQAFVHGLRPTDAVLPVYFNGEIHAMLPRATSDQNNLRTSISNLHTDTKDSGTRLYDAVDYASKQVLGSIKGRKAIILFTDGGDTWSKTTQKSTLAESVALGALVYAVYYDPSEQSIDATTAHSRAARALARDISYLRSLAGKTGGRYYEPKRVDAIKGAFEEIAAELRRQYSLGYYPQAAAQGARPRRITVKVNRPGVITLGRDSYIYESTSGQRP